MHEVHTSWEGAQGIPRASRGSRYEAEVKIFTVTSPRYEVHFSEFLDEVYLVKIPYLVQKSQIYTYQFYQLYTLPP